MKTFLIIWIAIVLICSIFMVWNACTSIQLNREMACKEMNKRLEGSPVRWSVDTINWDSWGALSDFEFITKPVLLFVLFFGVCPIAFISLVAIAINTSKK
ncbi:MAG: hypothetical protein KKD05_10820 [Candidatus Omnitrophica bacterium]|nr:hypothetical protein [Candidatus Omnitrophota bacterium]